ncbi:IclR family transcriptional regulator [Variovorax terrae]|uniref:IclR family transcriptional regulator n=1 Tax=Variovorax terrae TaxID=2923278 RepID=A0A9X1VSK5_9BURK|nr:IclR family transcriptional regulator [Variovorax terrae]MCJ0762568.1 IclR family transcriptional regulator [Variovorax terrae]
MNNTLIKGLQLLEVLASRDGTAGVSELALELGMGKSNVHRTLQALVELGYVVNEDSRGAYRASLKIWEVGARVIARLDVRRAASPAMQWLLEETRETVHLSVLDGDQVVYVDKLDSPEPVRAYSEIGGRAPAYCVATGKALLAWRDKPPALLRPAASPRQAFTPATLTDPAELVRELARIRAQGYAVNRGEWRASVWGVAAPIVDGTGQVVAAIGLSGPATRIKPTRVKSLAGLVTEAAQRVSDTLAVGGDAG